MSNEENALIELNNKINQFENEGDRDKLSNFIASKFAFLRADGITIDDRKEFLDKVKKLDNEAKEEPREISEIKPNLYNNRAIVTCIIKKGGKSFHNLRLFIKKDSEWKLLGWANEKLTDPKPIVLKFNECINNRDLEGLLNLMTEDHEFIDSAENHFTGKTACQKAWNSFFTAFPDYQNVFEKLTTKDNTAIIQGHSICSDKRLEGRAIWTAKITDDKVSEWRIYLDTEENRKKLAIN